MLVGGVLGEGRRLGVSLRRIVDLVYEAAGINYVFILTFIRIEYILK